MNNLGKLIGKGPQKFKRADNAEGVGHVIEHGGIPMASVSWPDGPAQKYPADQMVRQNVKCDGCDDPEGCDEHKEDPKPAAKKAAPKKKAAE